MILALVLHIAAASVDDAATLEDMAFVASDEKRYCDALALFTKANALAPNVDLLFNAGQVAAAAGDRKRALLIYAGLLDAYPDASQRAEVRKEMDALSARIEKEGAGTACETTPEPAPVKKESPPLDVAPLVPEPAPAAPPPAPSMLPWGLIAGGAAGVVGGGVLALVGAGPFFEYGAAVERVRAAEASGDVASAIGAQAKLDSARDEWTTWGQAASTLGAVAIGVGAIAIGAGAALLTMESP